MRFRVIPNRKGYQLFKEGSTSTSFKYVATFKTSKEANKYINTYFYGETIMKAEVKVKI